MKRNFSTGLLALFGLVTIWGLVTIGGLAMIATTPAQAQFGRKQEKQQIRSVSGQVTGVDNAPVKDAVVFLKNSRSLAIKSFITEAKGDYNFMELSPDIDYQVWAESNGQKSPIKTISLFDGRPQFHIDLHLQRAK